VNINRSMDRYKEAAQYMKMLYTLVPERPAAQKKYLEILTTLDAKEEALSLYPQVLKSQGDDPKAMALLIKTNIRFGRWKEASELLDRLQPKEPNNPYIPYARGVVYHEQGEFKKANDFLQQVPADSPDAYDAQYRLGLCRMSLQELEPAARIFIALLTDTPYDVKIYPQLEKALLRLQKRKGAQLLREIRQDLAQKATVDEEADYLWRRGDAVESARLRALSLVEKGWYREAESWLSEVCKTYPESLPAQENLAYFYIKTGQSCRAEDIYQKLLPQTSGENREALQLHIAEAELRQGKTDTAMNLLKTAGANGAFTSSLRTLLGTYYLEIEDKPAEALAFLSQVSDPSPEFQSALARANLGVGKLQEAWEILNRISDKDSNPQMAMAKAQCAAQMGRKEEAQSLLQAALQRDPTGSPLISFRAQAAAAMVSGATDREYRQQRAKEIEQKLRDIRRLLREAHQVGWSRSVPLLRQLSDIYASMHLPEEALQYARLALAGEPDNKAIGKKTIQLMNQPNRLFERLRLIKLYRDPKSPDLDFRKESEETLATIEMKP